MSKRIANSCITIVFATITKYIHCTCQRLIIVLLLLLLPVVQTISAVSEISTSTTSTIVITIDTTCQYQQRQSCKMIRNTHTGIRPTISKIRQRQRQQQQQGLCFSNNNRFLTTLLYPISLSTTSSSSSIGRLSSKFNSGFITAVTTSITTTSDTTIPKIQQHQRRSCSIMTISRARTTTTSGRAVGWFSTIRNNQQVLKPHTVLSAFVSSSSSSSSLSFLQNFHPSKIRKQQSQTIIATTTTRRISTSTSTSTHSHSNIAATTKTSTSIDSSSSLFSSISTDTNTNDDTTVMATEQQVQDMLYRIRQCNNIPNNIQNDLLLPFVITDYISAPDNESNSNAKSTTPVYTLVGYVHPYYAELLSSITIDKTVSNERSSNNEIVDQQDTVQVPVFEIVTTSSQQSTASSSMSSTSSVLPITNSHQQYITLTYNGAGTTYQTRTDAVATVLDIIRQQNILNNSTTTHKNSIIGQGWRNELLAVKQSYYDNPPLLAIERSCMPIFSCIEYGVHINGYVHVPVADADENTTNNDDSNKQSTIMKMWIGRRSATKSKYPNMLDHIAAGGQPVNIQSLTDNAIKECYEEAGIPVELCTPSNLRPVGIVSYSTYDSTTLCLQRAILFNYDLLLPTTFIPTPIDNEVQEFFKLSITELLELMSPTTSIENTIKPNCYLVIIDFLIRHGYISPDTTGYIDVIQELRQL